jgi:hypothetical protein
MDVSLGKASNGGGEDANEELRHGDLRCDKVATFSVFSSLFIGR